MIHSFLTASPGDMARVLMLPTMLALLAAGVGLTNLFTTKPPKNAIDSSAYKVREHVHVMDMDRAPLVKQPDGTVETVCCVQGCGAKIKLATPTMRVFRGQTPAIAPSNDRLLARHRNN